MRYLELAFGRLCSTLAVLSVGLALAGCADGSLQKLQTVYTLATESTVPSSQVVIAANAFDAVKATATNYGRYCIAQNFPRPICSAANRRAVIKYVNAGTAARVQLEASINTGQPALSTVYNALIAATNSLNTSAATTVKGS